MSLKKLIVCCCCPQTTDEDDGVNISVNINNSCCQKTQSVYTDGPAAKRNLFQSVASRVIRRTKATPEINKSISKQDQDIFKSAVDISVS